jgi:hypothetical protein
MVLRAMSLRAVRGGHWPETRNCGGHTNKRVVIVGTVLVGLAAAFFFGMSMIAKSNDPVVMMQTVGEVAGVVAGLGVVMILFGVFKKRS